MPNSQDGCLPLPTGARLSPGHSGTAPENYVAVTPRRRRRARRYRRREGASRLRHSTRLPPRLTPLSLEVERDFRVDPITRDFAALHRCGEFLDVNRADIAQGFRGFAYRALRGVFPALWRFR